SNSANSQSGRPRLARGGNAVPNEQDNDCADGGSNQAGTLIQPIPADGLTDEGCDEGPHDAEDGGQNKPAGIGRPGRRPSGNNPGDESDEDDPEDVHVVLSVLSETARWRIVRTESLRAVRPEQSVLFRKNCATNFVAEEPIALSALGLRTFMGRSALRAAEPSREESMGLTDILNGMQNGPRGQPNPNASSGGMSPIMMALLGLVAYKAVKHFTNQPNAAAAAPGSGAATASAQPGQETSAGGGLGGLLSGGLGGLGGLLAGGAAGSVLSGGLKDLMDQFQKSGQEEVAKSWVGTGPNKSI